MNKWLQWLLVSLIVAVIQGIASGLLGKDPFVIPKLLESIKLRDWAAVIYRLVLELGNLADGAYLLRALGLIKFL